MLESRASFISSQRKNVSVLSVLYERCCFTFSLSNKHDTVFVLMATEFISYHCFIGYCVFLGDFT